MNKKPTKFLFIAWLINIAILYLASLLYPEDIVFGNALISGWLSILVIAIVVTVIPKKTVFLLKMMKLKLKNEWILGAIYVLVNTIILWLLARLANYTGFGISSVFTAVSLGAVITLFHYGSKLLLGKKTR